MKGSTYDEYDKIHFLDTLKKYAHVKHGENTTQEEW